MKESEFRRFLQFDSGIISKDKAVATRISKGKSIENKYSISLDTIVSQDLTMYKYLLKINENFNNKNGGYSNALRKYYLFIKGREFPQLNEYCYQLNLAIRDIINK